MNLKFHHSSKLLYKFSNSIEKRLNYHVKNNSTVIYLKFQRIEILKNHIRIPRHFSSDIYHKTFFIYESHDKNKTKMKNTTKQKELPNKNGGEKNTFYASQQVRLFADHVIGAILKMKHASRTHGKFKPLAGLRTHYGMIYLFVVYVGDENWKAKATTLVRCNVIFAFFRVVRERYTCI